MKDMTNLKNLAVGTSLLIIATGVHAATDIGSYEFEPAGFASSATVSGNVTAFGTPFSTEFDVTSAQTAAQLISNTGDISNGFDPGYQAVALGVNNGVNDGVGTLTMVYDTPYTVAAGNLFVVYESGAGDEGNNIEISLDGGSTWLDGNAATYNTLAGPGFNWGEVAFDLSAYVGDSISGVAIRNLLPGGVHTGADDPDIAFAAFAVPEPTSLALLGLGGLIAMRRRR